MLKLLLRRLAAALCSLTLFPAAAAAAPALWAVRDADSTVYLFGTMHVLDPKLDWHTPAFDAAYAEAQTVWFETDAEADPAVIKNLVARYGVDHERPLLDKLSDRSLKHLKPLLNRERLPLERIANLRPWAAAMVLSIAPMVGDGRQVGAGADAVITRASHRSAKAVRTFETLEDQVRMFAGLPEAAEVQYLEDVIRDTHRPRFGPDLQSAWMKGDLARLAPTLVDEMRRDRPDLYAALLRNRNLAWADTLGQRMAGSGVELVNVGALHMIGQDGLPALMAARGYKVERIQ